MSNDTNVDPGVTGEGSLIFDLETLSGARERHIRPRRLFLLTLVAIFIAFVSILADLIAHSVNSINIARIGVFAGGIGAGLGGAYAAFVSEDPMLGPRGMEIIGSFLSAYGLIAGLGLVYLHEG
jgi:hypothetical protein